jgi:hypothetical protein
MDRERSARRFAGARVALWSTVATAFEFGLRDLSPAAPGSSAP